MSARYIGLGCGRRIGLGRYVAAWKACLGLPASTPIGRGISGWGETAGEALREFRAGLEERINRNVPGYGRGRKWSPDWQREMTQAAGHLNMPRLIIRWLPADLMKVPRFAERVRYGREAF
jgi:hypothetical protein